MHPTAPQKPKINITERDQPQPLSPTSEKMFEKGLKAGHEDCERQGLQVQSVDGPEKGIEEMKEFAALRHWEQAFDMTPRTTVKQLMVMGNMFKFLNLLTKKLSSGVNKILFEIANVKAQGLTEEQEGLCATVDKFLHMVETDSDVVNVDECDNQDYFEQNRFAQQCSSCPRHRCGIFEDNDRAQTNNAPQCNMCPVHKCILKFKTQEWRSVGRPPKIKGKEATEIVGSKSKK